MDRKQFITALTLSVTVCALWFFWVRWYDKNHPQPPVSTVAATTQPVEPTPIPTTNTSTTNPTTGPAVVQAPAAPTMAPSLVVAPSTQPSSANVILGSAAEKDPNYAMQLVLTPLGASVVDVTLNDFPAPDDGKSGKSAKERYRFETELPDKPATRVLATRALVIDEKTVDLWNVPWTKVASDANSASFVVIINDSASQPLVKVMKKFTLPTRAATKGKSDGFEVAVEQTIQNLQPGRAIKVHAILNGPTPPPSEVEHAIDHTVVMGYNEAGKTIAYLPVAFTDFKSDSATKDLTSDKHQQHFVWAGEASSYFGAILLPDAPQQANLTVHADGLNLNDEDRRAVTLTFDAPDVSITDKPQMLGMNVFFGPKWRDYLDNAYYSSFPHQYNLIVSTSSGMCGWCAFQPLINGLVKLLAFFHFIFRDWGVAIICLVLLVRTLLHPITKRSQVQMMKMGKLGPEVEKLKKKYADQPDVLNREMMKLYKQQGGAILGCLPMFLQTPIWIALWTALQGTFELRQAPFLHLGGHDLTWIHDLAKPDMLIRFSQPIPLFLFGWHMSAINILPILMAAVTYINQKYFMPMPIAATPEQEQQQKMQRGMSLIFPLMFYSLPSGLNIYYLTSMSLGILESKIIRDHIKEQDELAKKMGPEIVEARPTRGSRRGGNLPDNNPPKKTGLMGKLLEAMEKAQERAEQIRKESNKGKGK